MRSLLLFFGALSFCLFSGSCKKIQENKILKGNWELMNSQIAAFDNTNMMTVLLSPPYDAPTGCCRYMIDFMDEGKCKGTYYVHDTIAYIVEGSWELLEFNKVFIDLDLYVNGQFDICRLGGGKFELSTKENTGILFGTSPVTSDLTMKVQRQ